LRHNIAQLRARLASGARFCFVVKADAYGHGLVQIAKCGEREGVGWLAVATVAEGVVLREAGVQIPILTLSPVLPLDADTVTRHGLRAMVEESEAARALSVAAKRQGVTLKIHLKVDTGMARFGVQPENAVALAREIVAMPGLELEGIATHFSSAAVDLDYTEGQYRTFSALLADLAQSDIHIPIVHCTNSAALMRFSHVQHQLVRTGLLAFGIRNVPCPDVGLQPVMTWRTRIMALREIPAGRRVGYAGTWTTEKRTRVATLGAGYADGYPRELSNKGRVVIHGREAPIRGIVCMDQTMVDVTDIPEAKIGDVAGLVEGPVSAERLAEWVGTTPHEIPCRLTARVQRVYVGE